MNLQVRNIQSSNDSLLLVINVTVIKLLRHAKLLALEIKYNNLIAQQLIL